jgi:hypothetical protein
MIFQARNVTAFFNVSVCYFFTNGHVIASRGETLVVVIRLRTKTCVCNVNEKPEYRDALTEMGN